MHSTSLPLSSGMSTDQWGSGAGKSTIARGIAAAHGLRLHSTDGAMADHARRSNAEKLRT